MNEANAVNPDVAGQSDMEHSLDFEFKDSLDENDLERMQADTAGDGNGFSFENTDSQPMGSSLLAGEAEEPAKAASKNNLNLLIVIALVVGILAIGAFGYFALKFLGGNNQQASNRSQLAQDLAEVGVADTNEFTSSEADVEALAQSLSAAPPREVAQAAEPLSKTPQVQQEVAMISSGVQLPENDILITQGFESLGVDAVNTPDAGITAKPSSEQVVTEEERLYDNLLSSVAGMDVPPEAIKIDQDVINRRLENQRINTLEQEVKEARSNVAGIQSAVEGMRIQVSSFAQAIESNSTKQAAIGESITKLTEQVQKATELQEKELESIKAAVAKAQKSADIATAAAREAKTVAQVPVAVQAQAAAPVREPVIKAPVAPVVASRNVVVREPIAAATAPVSPAKVFSEQPVPAVVQAQTENQSTSGTGLPSHCNGTRVSANWRVKGVNSSSAYVVRSQDQQGMYLKVGVDVPGYGQVQAFDSNGRAVCTTSGLIRR